MRPLIIIDGAHRKGNYLGTNLVAGGMDGNNQIIPLATDRHAAIIQACGIVFDNSFHGFCDHHLMRNCNLKGKKLRGIFWKACKAYTTEDFNKAISELRGHRPEVVRKLEEAEAPENELCDWAATKVYDGICRKWQLFGLPCGHVCAVFRVPDKKIRSRRGINRNRRVYMDWDDVQVSEEPVTTTEGMAVEDWQPMEGRLDSYNSFINFLSQAENDNYYQ
ncbi:hypothetical protein Tco_0850982 [Tanacetum coccineum]